VDAVGAGIGDQGLGSGELGLAIYVAGVLWGLLVIDAPPATKIALAILWPIGPLAFAVTVTILLAASLIAFPVFGVAVLLAAAAAWLFVQ
jgi:hypothetical protein